MKPQLNILAAVVNNVRQALQEDIGNQDLTANLIPADTVATAHIISREPATLCGRLWVNEAFVQVDPAIQINWFFDDGDRITANDILCEMHGSARSLLTVERCALNFIQTLSATATIAQQYADAVKGISVKVLDTRKTIPGLRIAQKYAVSCGGCYNHRIGLFDGILIKENHILATGSIAAAIDAARMIDVNVPLEIEVETLDELEQALAAKADIILLDNFSTEQLKQAVATNSGKAQLEASGGITLSNIRQTADTGVDRISIGALTKDIQSIDLSMRFL